MTEIYKANDGTIFEDQDECERYEMWLEFKGKSFPLLGRNDSAETINVRDIIEGRASVEDIFFVICHSKEESHNLDMLFTRWGCYPPELWQNRNENVTPQKYFWEEHFASEDRWRSLDDLRQEIKYYENIFEEMQKRA